MLFKKYKNYLKLRVAISQYNQCSTAEKISFKQIINSISDLTDDLEVNGVIDSLNGIY